MAKAGFYCRVFLDDFICITVVSRAAEALAYLRGLLAMFGLVENQRKLIGPSDDLVILGVRYVFSQGQASVSEERVPKVLAQLELVAGAKTTPGVTAQEAMWGAVLRVGGGAVGPGSHLSVVAGTQHCASGTSSP